MHKFCRKLVSKLLRDTSEVFLLFTDSFPSICANYKCYINNFTQLRDFRKMRGLWEEKKADALQPSLSVSTEEM